MYSEFAYSHQMQILLAFVTYAETFLATYMIANVIMVTFQVAASRKQKLLFAFITGSILQNTFVYAVYMLGSRMSFNNFTYFLVVNPNPITALLYYYTAQKVFKLSPVRSVKLMSYVYIFWITSNVINRYVGALFFVQNDVRRYNYLLDATQQIVALVLFFFICTLIRFVLRKSHASLNFSENMMFNERKELIIYFLKAAFVYAVTVALPLILRDQAIAHIIVALILLLFVVINICLDVIRYNKQTISNRDIHIRTLFKGMEELQGIEHDFNNILHTYSGYLELKEYERLEHYHESLVSATSHTGSIMELAQKMRENPAVIALCIKKLEYAESMNVKLILSLQCDVNHLYVDDLDVSRAMSYLFDYAIEAASESSRRKVYATIESKSADAKLIIITGSTAILLNPKSASQLTAARRILEKYGNCSFQTQYSEDEFSAYIELKKSI